MFHRNARSAVPARTARRDTGTHDAALDAATAGVGVRMDALRVPAAPGAASPGPAGLEVAPYRAQS
ncbi:hypothetical protein GCM10022377_25980 [Zhihengliuella alba]|uniref:Uncharacterized protein n=1 Tax=Zhihengliuella alba TaxID=547018 RepID=A0ABP7DWZ2_9MICC